jgi:hypothetical protein
MSKFKGNLIQELDDAWYDLLVVSINLSSIPVIFMLMSKISRCGYQNPRRKASKVPKQFVSLEDYDGGYEVCC